MCLSPGVTPACLALTNSLTPLKQPPKVPRLTVGAIPLGRGLQIPLTPEISGTATFTPFPCPLSLVPLSMSHPLHGVGPHGKHD